VEYMLAYGGVCVTPEDYVFSQKRLGMDWVVLTTGKPKEYPGKRIIGAKSEFRSDNQIVWWVDGTLKTREDLEDFKVQFNPDDLELVFNRVNKKTVEIAHENNMAVIGLVGGIWQDSKVACGLKTVFVNVFKQPDLMRDLFDFFSRYNAEIGKQFVDLGVDAVIIGDDLAHRNGPDISPKLFKNMVFPFARRIVQEIQQKGIKVIWHSDGNTYLILDDLVNYVGIDGYHAIEPMAGMDIGIVKEKYGDKISLFGNVDCSHTLCLGTLTDVMRETTEIIKKAAYGGGLNVNSSNSIHNAVKLENFQSMIRTVHKVGQYPYK